MKRYGEIFFSEQQTISPIISSHLKEGMKKNIFISSFVLLISCYGMAQRQDSVPVRSLAEKGSQGDILLGKEAKRDQLSAPPQMLNAADSSQKKDIQSKNKRNTETKMNSK